MPHQSLGIIETKGLAAAIEAGDMIARTADINFIGKELSGENFIALFIKGDLGAVKTSLEAASSLIQPNGELIAFHIIPCPHSEIENLLLNVNEAPQTLADSVGIIETKGITGAIAAADAMIKTAEINIINWEHILGSPVILKVHGDIEHVKAALEAGTEISRKLKQFIKTRIISNPDKSLNFLIYKTDEEKKDIRNLKVVADSNNVQEINITPEVIAKSEVNEKQENSEKKKTKKAIIKPKVPVEKKRNKSEDEKPSQKEKKETVKINAPVKKIEDNGQHDLFALSFHEAPDAAPEIIETADNNKVDVLQANDENTETAPSPKIPDFRYEELEKFTVSKLRKLARDIENFPIKGRVISMANKNILLGYFKELK